MGHGVCLEAWSVEWALLGFDWKQPVLLTARLETDSPGGVTSDSERRVTRAVATRRNGGESTWCAGDSRR